MFGDMKIVKVKFEKIDRFKELIELTGLVSYSVDSDDGRDIIINLKCAAEGHSKKELHDFVCDFHADYFHFWPGEAYLKVVNNEIEISWQESQDLLLEDIQYDFNEMICSLFSLPSESTIDTMFKLNFNIEGVFRKEITIETFVFVLSVNPAEVLDFDFSDNELKKVKAGLLFKNANQIQEKFEMHLKKLLKKYRASNCTFSLSGDECFLSSFCTSEIESRKIVLSDK